MAKKSVKSVINPLYDYLWQHNGDPSYVSSIAKTIELMESWGLETNNMYDLLTIVANNIYSISRRKGVSCRMVAKLNAELKSVGWSQQFKLEYDKDSLSTHLTIDFED